jgi:hypothetical protein
MTDQKGNKQDGLLNSLLNEFPRNSQIDQQIIELLQNVKNIDIGKAVDFNEECTDERFRALVMHLSSQKLSNLDHINHYKEDLVKETMRVKDIYDLMWYCYLIKDSKDPFFVRCLKENLEKRLLREEEQKEYFFINLIDRGLIDFIDTVVLESWDIQELEFNGDKYDYKMLQNTSFLI